MQITASARRSASSTSTATRAPTSGTGSPDGHGDLEPIRPVAARTRSLDLDVDLDLDLDLDLDEVVVAAERPAPHDAARRRPDRASRRRPSGRIATSRPATRSARVTFQPRNRATNAVRRAVPHLGRAAGLGNPARLHHDHAVGEPERLVVVVGHEDDRQPEADEELPQLGDESVAQRPVERTERLVEHQQLRCRRQRTREGDALLLAAGELARPAGARSPRARRAFERLPRPGFGFGARPTLHAQPEAHVADHVAVREQRVVLEHEAEPAAMRRYAGRDRRRSSARARSLRARARRRRGGACSSRSRSARAR